MYFFLVPKCLTSGIISQVFPLHEPAALERLQNTWVRNVLARQPLGKHINNASNLHNKNLCFRRDN